MAGKGIARDRLYSEADAADALGMRVFELRWLMSPKGAAANGTRPLRGITLRARRMVRGRMLTAWLASVEGVSDAAEVDG